MSLVKNTSYLVKIVSILYVALLCDVFSVAEPKSGFEIAFNMFDIDGNKRVDIDEFKVVCIFL